jgi:hypothetical protein
MTAESTCGSTVVVAKVRRETLDLTECNCHPQTGSLHPAVMQRLGLNEFSAL